MNISLTDRNIEIIKDIPQKYRAIIINGIIAKSVDTGLFTKECSYFLDSDTLEKISSELQIELKPRKIALTRKDVKKRIEENKDDIIFDGFD
jgi:hypothetical protein